VKADWQLDPALTDLAEVMAEVQKAPTHVHVRALIRTLRSLSPDLPQRLPPADRSDLVRSLEDCEDMLRDLPDLSQSRLGQLVEEAGRRMEVLAHRLDQAGEHTEK
jgi:hypothetical protein